MPPRSMLRWISFQAGFLLALLGGPALASAQAALPAHAPAGLGQAALSVFSGKGGELMAATCATAPCSAGAISLNLPAELRNGPAQAELASLGQGRHALVVTVADGIRTFKAVLVAPLGGGAPKVLFSGLTGLTSGQPGERSGKMVQVVDGGGGVSLVLVGEQWESVSLCGRPTILAPQLLNPKTLQLQNAKVQRLPLAERDAASSALVRRMADDEPSSAVSGVLRGLSASSAVGAPQAITDGDPETTWSEDRGGDGKGEFIV
ncbi:MAG TPA: hypothetical protein VEX18_00620, partial [Polyangiaceae bacterium]|nr:hypothetical protein [Polyangiaceae bacterium]